MVSCTVEDSCEMHHKDVYNCGLNFAVSDENRPKTYFSIKCLKPYTIVTPPLHLSVGS